MASSVTHLKTPRAAIVESEFLQRRLQLWLALDSTQQYRSELGSPLARKSMDCWRQLFHRLHATEFAPEVRP